jgi:LacI family transcriptional regulator
MRIIHHIAKELNQRGASMMYTYLPTYYTSAYSFPTSFGTQEISGLIVLNVYDEKFLKMLAKLPIPKVFLDTTPGVPYDQLNGDLLMIEGRISVHNITRRLLERGYSRIGFIGDVAYAQTNTDRYNGFLDAFDETGRSIDPSLCMTNALGLHTHYEELSRFLDGLSEMPEAFVCVSDYIAHFITQYCEDHKIPEEQRPILTGFDNSSEYGNVAGRITTVDVDTIAVGTRLASKILFASEHQKAAHEVSYLSTKIVFRGPLE